MGGVPGNWSSWDTNSTRMGSRCLEGDNLANSDLCNELKKKSYSMFHYRKKQAKLRSAEGGEKRLHVTPEELCFL